MRTAKQRIFGLFALARNSLSQNYSQTQAGGEGPSFVVMIPYVTTENNSRTNLGLNNYSQLSFVRGINPTATVFMYLFDREGNLRRSGSTLVQSNELVQISDVIN